MFVHQENILKQIKEMFFFTHVLDSISTVELKKSYNLRKHI